MEPGGAPVSRADAHDIGRGQRVIVACVVIAAFVVAQVTFAAAWLLIGLPGLGYLWWRWYRIGQLTLVRMVPIVALIAAAAYVSWSGSRAREAEEATAERFERAVMSGDAAEVRALWHDRYGRPASEIMATGSSLRSLGVSAATTAPRQAGDDFYFMLSPTDRGLGFEVTVSGSYFSGFTVTNAGATSSGAPQSPPPEQT
jgi:hypothetical protein